MRCILCVLSLAATSLLCGCTEHDDEALVASVGSVSVYRYRATSPVNSFRVEIDGEEYRSGSRTSPSQDIELAIVERPHETEFHLRIGGGVLPFSVPGWEEPGGKSKDIQIHNRRSLKVDGATQIYRLTDKSMDNATKSRVVRVFVE